MTIIIHPFKKFRTTDNILCLWFISFARWDLLEKLQKASKMFKELKQDKQIVDNLLNDGNKQAVSNQRKS